MLLPCPLAPVVHSRCNSAQDCGRKLASLMPGSIPLRAANLFEGVAADAWLGLTFVVFDP